MSDRAAPAPALLALRDQIDARWPSRDRASDGTLGDAAHQAGASDHNQGDALDITSDPAQGPDLDALADALIQDERVHYVIWNRRIRNRAFDGGAWRPYAGASPHTQHLHVSVHAGRREDRSAWRLPPSSAATGDAPKEVAPEVRRAGALVVGVGFILLGAWLADRAGDETRARATLRGWRATP